MKSLKSGVIIGFLGLLAVGITAGTQAADQPAGKKPRIVKAIVTGTQHQALFGIAFDQGKGVAVGVGGAIMESQDAGVSWKPVSQSLMKSALLAVDRRGDAAVAVGQGGNVLLQDASGSWTKADAGTTSRLLAVSMNASGLVVIGGEFGTVLKSTDGGNTWASISPTWETFITDVPGAAEPHIYSAKVNDAGVITIAGEFGLILQSADGGSTWQVSNPSAAASSSVFAMHLSDTGDSYAVGQRGMILKSTDAGATWQPIVTGSKGNFLGVTTNPQGQVVITGMRVMLRSHDNGTTWKEIRDGDSTTDWYQAVKTADDAGRVMAVGHSGKIIQIGG